MKTTKFLALFAALVLLCGCLTACGEDKKNDTDNGTVNNGGSATTPPKQVYLNDAYADKDYGFQLEGPQRGDTIAIMHTNMGDICIRLFPEAAPKAVVSITVARWTVASMTSA